jgi:protein gp37
MADHSKIEWTDASDNIVTGCTRVSEGCDNCYIERTPPFRMEGRRFDQVGVGGMIPVRLHPDRLLQPLRWRRPRRIFMPSLGDLFHDDVPDEFIAKSFAVASLARRHTYQITTKRPARMRSLLNGTSWRRLCEDTQDQLNAEAYEAGVLPRYEFERKRDQWWSDFTEPLPNVWLGVSVENQKWADIRVPALLDTPAAVRWLSCEPLLGPVNLDPWRNPGDLPDPRTPADSRLNWVVVGGESGPRARPMHPDWARSLRDQCTSAGVPFFFKQHGEYCPADVQRYSEALTFTGRGRGCVVEPCGRVSVAWSMGGGDLRDDGPTPDAAVMLRVGKRAAGRALDGRTWDEYPAQTGTVAGGVL